MILRSRDSTATFPVETVAGTIMERFDLIADQHASQAAIDREGQTWTYGELCARSHAVATALAGLALEPGTLVAILSEDPFKQITSMLGILRAGHAFVVLDAFQPDQRLASQLVGCGALMADQAQHTRGDALRASMPLLLLHDEQVDSKRVPAGEAGSTDLAYVIYTSGSTGKPKGVMLAHRNLLHNVMRYTHDAGISAGDRLTLLFSCSFGAGILDVYAALLNGATLYPLSVKQSEGVQGLVRQLCENEITIYHSVPTLFRQLCPVLEACRDSLKVRLVKLTGDRSYGSDVVLYRCCFPDHCQLLNSLGITEAGLVRHYFMTQETPLPEGLLPVGYPVQDVRLDLVDDQGGAATEGEIVVRSDYLALGYWRQPELTAKVFRTFEGDRAYWTGDLGRMDDDECVHLIGRAGSQVNVKGYRVDLGEVEQGLLANPDVTGAVVLGGDDGHGDTRLVAFVVANEGRSLSVNAVRRRLRDQVPDYMLPHRFVFLDELPMTATGKVDRRQLEDPSLFEVSVLEPDSDAYDTETERELASIWQEVLDLPSIGRRVDFFEAGGGSLQAVAVCGAIEKRLGVRVEVSELFEAPTFLELGQLIGNRGSKSREVVVPIHPTGSKAPLYVVHGLTGEVIHYHNLRKYLRGDRPVHGLQLPEREFASLREMAQHYCEELRRCQPQGPYLLSGYSFGGNVAFEMARILTESRSEVVFVGLFEGVSPKLGWSEMRWRPALLGHWARSLPGWLREILGRPSVMGKAFWRRLNRWSRRRAHLQTPIQVEDFADEHQSKVQRLVGLSRNHTPEPYPGRVHLFRTGALGFHHVDPEMGWGRRARGGVSIHHVLGTHEDMLYEPQVASLAQELQRALDDLPC